MFKSVTCSKSFTLIPLNLFIFIIHLQCHVLNNVFPWQRTWQLCLGCLNWFFKCVAMAASKWVPILELTLNSPAVTFECWWSFVKTPSPEWTHVLSVYQRDASKFVVMGKMFRRFFCCAKVSHEFVNTVFTTWPLTWAKALACLVTVHSCFFVCIFCFKPGLYCVVLWAILNVLN